MNCAPPPRVLPEGVPTDAEPISEDQIERLPDYVQQLLQESMNGNIPHVTTREDLERIRAAFFSPAAAEARVEVAIPPISNSMECCDVDEESMCSN